VSGDSSSSSLNVRCFCWCWCCKWSADVAPPPLPRPRGRLRDHYRFGKSGSISKNSVYLHYLDACGQRGLETDINQTFFGKLVKKAFPGIQYNRYTNSYPPPPQQQHVRHKNAWQLLFLFFIVSRPMATKHTRGLGAQIYE
jgi:hypothetical protein